MDVTRRNFDEAMVLLERALESEELEFVSMDEEMTGLWFKGAQFEDMNAYADSPSERYAKFKRVASSFGMVQLGVCAWTRSKKRGRLTAHCLNVFVFSGGDDVVVSPGTVEFLSQNGMDWNRCLKESVKLADKATAYRPPPLSTLKAPADVKFASVEGAKIRGFLRSNPTRGMHATEPSPSAAAARWTRELVDREFGARARVERLPGFRIGIVPLTAAERPHAEALLQAKAKERKGARRLYEAVSKACKRGAPLVGHNCYFDVLFLMRHLDAPLPDEYAAFKKRVHADFPTVYDTKALASKHRAVCTQGVKTTVSDLFAHLKASDSLALNPCSVALNPACRKYASPDFPVAQKVDVSDEDGQVLDDDDDDDENDDENDDEKSSNDDDDRGRGAAAAEKNDTRETTQYHEAGYDALVTGYIYARLGPMPDLENKLFLLRSQFHVDLASESETEPVHWRPRGEVFLLKGAVPHDAVARLFLATVKIHKIAYNGPDAWLVDIEAPEDGGPILVAGGLPAGVAFAKWPPPVAVSAVPASPDLPRHKRLFSWIKTKFAGGSIDPPNRKRRRYSSEPPLSSADAAQAAPSLANS